VTANSNSLTVLQTRLKIHRAVVLGAGVMGAQVAAHLAAAGVRTHLLDLPSEQPIADPKLAKIVGIHLRNQRAILALEQLKNLKPSPLMTQSCLQNIIAGNFDDDMSVVAEADWVFEAVIEKMDIKKKIHARIAEYVRPGVPVSSNTSGLSLGDITKDLPESYQKVFSGIHFFNPPRYMKLVELIPSQQTDLKLAAQLGDFVERTLGKGIVYAQDTVNFIANRVGVLTICASMRHMQDLGLNIETVDALTGSLMGRPASGTFRTMDVVGIDTFSLVAASVYDRAHSDAFRAMFQMPTWVHDLIAHGQLGQKTKDVGAYKKIKNSEGGTVILAYRADKKSYEEQQVAQIPWLAEAGKKTNLIERLQFVLSQQDAAGQFVWRILRDTMVYSALLVEEIAGGMPKSVDDAIRWGFNWELGPFELWQALGFQPLKQRMLAEGSPLPAWSKSFSGELYQPSPGSDAYDFQGPAKQYHVTKAAMVATEFSADKIRLPKKMMPGLENRVFGNAGASVLDIGEGIACLTFHTKMNALDDHILEATSQAVSVVKKDFDGLVIANDGQAFSAGANLKLILEQIRQEKFVDLDALLRRFQGTLLLLKYAPFPTVACSHGLTLGGGCEVSLQTARRVIAAETYAGLVEAGVGLVPGAGGTKELALGAYRAVQGVDRADPMPYLTRAFLMIGLGKVSSSGQDAVEMGLFPSATTEVCFSRDYQVSRAKQTIRWMLDAGYRAPMVAKDIPVVGDPGLQVFRMMLYNMEAARQISSHDRLIGEKIATILCGGEVDAGTLASEQTFLDLERRMFLELCQESKTVARIEHMLKTGKPLRN
jgi:3-hydroxyacyl-CoA dehydrogenase